MKILITGGAGFIGSHIAEFYARRESEVVVFDNLSRGAFVKATDEAAEYNWNHLSQYPRVKRIKGDVRDYEALESAMRGCEAVFHTAAQVQIRASIADPVEDFTTNALGTFNLLESARRLQPQPKIIYTSTAKVYGINLNRFAVETDDCYKLASKYSQGIPEDFPVDGIGHTPFGASKLAGDLYMQEYAHLFGLKIGVFRLSTIYGERAFGFEEQGWMARIAALALMDKTVDIFGGGKTACDPLFIGDLLEAFDAFMKSDLRGGLFNLGGGPENALSQLQFIKLLKIETGKEIQVTFNDVIPYQQKVFLSDNSKAGRLLNWSPQVDLKEGVPVMLKWIEENL